MPPSFLVDIGVQGVVSGAYSHEQLQGGPNGEDTEETQPGVVETRGEAA